MMRVGYQALVCFFAQVHADSRCSNLARISTKDLQGNPKPEVPQTGPKPVRGRGTFLRIFLGQGILFRVGLGQGILFWVGPGQGVFYRGMRHFHWDFGDKLAFHSQTEEVEWL